MKLNLGCGPYYVRGWHNVDHGFPGYVDERVDLSGDLPWPADSLDAVYAGHVLEHISEEDCVSLLSSLLVCARTGAEILVVGPDVEKASYLQQHGYRLEISLESIIYGAGAWQGDVHLWKCTASKIEELLSTAGWSEVGEISMSDVSTFWPIAFRHPQWQCVVHAVKAGV